MDWDAWVEGEFSTALERAIVRQVAKALTQYRSRAIVLQKLMTSPSQLHHWLGDAPEMVTHDDPAKWAELFAAGWGWIDHEELVFQD